jgi:small subunit ribosomal protein S6
MFLLDSGKYASNPDAVTKEVLGILEKVGATVLAHRPWQDGKLAYPIDNHKKGLYFLTYFRMDGRELPAVLRACKLNETIIRQLILKVDPALVEPLLAIATGEGIPLTNFTDDQATTTAVGAPDVEAAI